MKVFVLLRLDLEFYCTTELLGVFSTKEKAEEIKQKFEENEKDFKKWIQH